MEAERMSYLIKALKERVVELEAENKTLEAKIVRKDHEINDQSHSAQFRRVEALTAKVKRLEKQWHLANTDACINEAKVKELEGECDWHDKVASRYFAENKRYKEALEKIMRCAKENDGCVMCHGEAKDALNTGGEE